MGFFKTLSNMLGGSSSAGAKHRIIVVGLDNSGKTTLVNIIKPKKVHARRSGRSLAERFPAAPRTARTPRLGLRAG